MNTPAQIYAYRIFDLMLVQELFKYRPQLNPALYVDENWNGEQAAVRQAIIDGYRWVRSDSMYAIFEKIAFPHETKVEMIVPLPAFADAGKRAE